MHNIWELNITHPFLDLLFFSLADIALKISTKNRYVEMGKKNYMYFTGVIYPRLFFN